MNALIGYLLAVVDRDLQELLLFSGAIGLKFLVNDFGLHENHGPRYDRLGRWLVMAAILLGWAAGAFAGVPQAALAIFRSFLVGGIIMNILKEELPENRESRFWPFALSATLYGTLLLVV